MADNDMKIWQNHLLPNAFDMIDAKFDLVLMPISRGNPAMRFEKYITCRTYKTCKTRIIIWVMIVIKIE